MRAWNRIVVQEDVGALEYFPGRGVLPGLNVAMCAEDVEATRQGYKCIQCFENFENAWPETCVVCGFPVKTLQAEKFAQVYKGYDPTLRVGEDWDAAADRLEARKERREWQRRAKKSGLILAKRWF